MEPIQSAKFDDSFLLQGYYAIRPLGTLKELKCHVYYDGPMMFECRHPDGYNLFATMIDEINVSPKNWQTWYIMRHYTEDALKELTDGHVTIKKFYEGNVIISCYVHLQDKHTVSYVVPLSIVPEKYQPSDVLLPFREKECKK